MSYDRSTRPPYGVAPEYVLAPPRPEDRLGAPAPQSPSLPGHALPPPRPEDRLHFGPPYPQDRPLPRPEEQRQGPVAMPDRRRLDLQAALTAAGVAPTDGDLAALAEIAALGDTTAGAVINWLGTAARGSWPHPHAV
ncbi:hypothetical protein [Streptomyces sp. NPDC048611]|uniref:hypothetical protein n=1 Tax=unclassified Streptomyces TaxID=2593676 RepID=UPI003425C557